MRILIADKLSPEGAEYLRREGAKVTIAPGLNDHDLAAQLREHDGVVVRSAVQITCDVLDMAFGSRPSAVSQQPSADSRQPYCRLRAIARAGVGVDNIDLDAATRHGIAVMNSAAASTITTAEHAFALMIALARNVAHSHMTMSCGGWDRTKFTGRQLHGLTLGVVGFGRIGQTMARRALAFGMRVIAYDPFINADSALDGQVQMLRSFDDLVSRADVVSFHVPKTDTTAGMLGREQFALAKPGLLVVNAARGGIVDEDALLEAIESGQCGGAAIDVFPKEPPPADSPLRSHPKILCTPHLGASTVEAQEAVSFDACRSLLCYLRGEAVDGLVNLGRIALDLSDRQQSFVDLASRMIALLDAAVGDFQLSTVQFTVRGESLAGRADTIARFALADLLQHHLERPVNVVNAGLIADQRNLRHETIITGEAGEDRLAVELIGRHEDGLSTPVHRVEGAIYADGLPRITHLDGYSMDMVPAGHMVLLTNADQPGRIGLVGRLFGDANVNIAEMVIGRKPADGSGATRPRERGGSHGEQVAMMILKIDERPSDSLLKALREAPGIISVAAVELPPVRADEQPSSTPKESPVPAAV